MKVEKKTTLLHNVLAKNSFQRASFVFCIQGTHWYCSNDGSTHPSFINSSLHSFFIDCSDDRHFPIPWRCQESKETKQTITWYFTERGGGKLQPLSKRFTKNQGNRRTCCSLTLRTFSGLHSCVFPCKQSLGSVRNLQYTTTKVTSNSHYPEPEFYLVFCLKLRKSLFTKKQKDKQQQLWGRIFIYNFT